MRKNSKQYIEVNCNECGTTVTKEKKEYDRQLKKGNKDFYCDLVCSGKHKTPHPDSMFRFIVSNAKKSSKRRGHLLDFNISVDYLKKLWQSQGGKCSYTNIPLVLPTHSYISSPRKASLDRVDSSKGYVEGNVEFVSVFVNLGKNGFDKKEIVEMLQEFKQN